ncbi:phospholipase A1-IIgamma-like [Andrographis paniculata]|uniref:phospholipase A1-IIgamma-like n=1 Tax=Andrographis paniculata TaxID=175694 RepID=UPI0021E7AB5B|nr:phospholipase A1-IIgamma-like [Andrographis paniculata]
MIIEVSCMECVIVFCGIHKSCMNLLLKRINTFDDGASEIEKMITDISRRWRVLSGLNNWQNLLNPLDGDLQSYLLHYGSMAQATYDAFNSEKRSKYGGSCRYAKNNLFSKVGLVKANPFKYKAVKYIYATADIEVPKSFILKPLRHKAAWCGKSNWMGYVAVATDEGKIALGRRDILVAWRGTIMPVEWAKDFEFPLVSASTIFGKACGDAKVHQGVVSLYTSFDPNSNLNKTSARDQVLSEVRRLLKQYMNEEVSITITGHSLGGALASLNAADIVCNGLNKISRSHSSMGCPVTGFLFGAMRIGDFEFRDILESMKDIHILRVCNATDIVPYYPTVGYSVVGVELEVDNRKSPYLKRSNKPAAGHNLESAYLHAVAMEKEKGKEWKRDVANANRTMNALKDKLLIPARWWVEKNKGMVQLENGRWALQDHETDLDEDD